MLQFDKWLLLGFRPKYFLISLLPWWLDSKGKLYERTQAWTYGRSWKDLEIYGSLLEWLGLANTKWLVSLLGPHAHPTRKWCTPNIEPRSYEKCISVCRFWRTSRIWWRCSSQIWLKIKMSSKYNTMYEFVKALNMSSIILMEVAGEFINPECMTSHMKKDLGF